MCGLAWSPAALLAARVVQGVGAAVMTPTALSIISTTFPEGSERNKALGIWGALGAVGATAAWLIGGPLVDGPGWQWIFFINIPLGLTALALSPLLLRESRATLTRRSYDPAGALTITGALVLLVYAVVKAPEAGWGDVRTILPLAGSALLLAAFALIESRHRAPLVPLRILRSRTLVGANAVMVLIGTVAVGMPFVLTLYAQRVLGYSAVKTGVIFLPLSLVSFVVAPIAGRLSTRIPVRILLSGGLALTGVALLLMHGLTLSSTASALIPGFVVAGIGIGLVNAPLASTAVSVVEPRRAGMASGINNTFRQVGIATGIAALGAIFQSRITSDIAASGNVPAGDVDRFAQAVASGATQQALQAVPAQFRSQAATLADSAFISGLNTILLVSACILFAGAVFAFVLVRQRDFVASGAPVEAASG